MNGQQANINSSTHNTIEGRIFWEEKINQFKKTDISGKEFCRQQSLNYHRFQYWNQKLKSSANADNSLIAIKTRLAPSTEVICTLEISSRHKLLIHDLCVLPHILANLC